MTKTITWYSAEDNEIILVEEMEDCEYLFLERKAKEYGMTSAEQLIRIALKESMERYDRGELHFHSKNEDV